jgi:formate/nitrite transporter FocA (FNT family)
MLTKILVLSLLALIVISLFSALAMLLRNDDQAKRERVVKALTVRVALSMGLLLVLLAGLYFGFIPPSGLK